MNGAKWPFGSHTLLAVSLTQWSRIHRSARTHTNTHTHTHTHNLKLCVSFSSLHRQWHSSVISIYSNQPFFFFSQNFNIYKRLFLDLVNLPDTDGPESYRMWADLRSFLLQLVNHITFQFGPSELESNI